MRLIELRVRGLMRVSAVDIRPGKGVTRIKGKNESGKTSTLDALWIAIKGRSVAPAEPIRQGEEKAVIQASLGNGKVDLVITRTFTRVKDREYTQQLDVRTGEGVKVTKSPQAMLDALAGELGFDPLTFERAPPKDQFDMMRKLVPGVDFDSIAAKRREAYEDRTAANRQATDATARASGVQLPDGPKPKAVDVSGKIDQLAAASKTNASITRFVADDERMSAEADRLNDEAERLRSRANSMEVQAKGIESQVAALRKQYAAIEPVDEVGLRAEIAEADKVKGILTLYERRDEHFRQMAHYQTAADALTATIEALDKQKADALAAAKLPVEGLGLGEGEVTYKGLPFAQASAAVKMRVSVAVAMALNPNLKVILVRDGSLLDEDSLALLAEMAAEHGFDVLLETIDTSVPGGFEIVDGANAPAG